MVSVMDIEEAFGFNNYGYVVSRIKGKVQEDRGL
jgi:hypothetical protein